MLLSGFAERRRAKMFTESLWVSNNAEDNRLVEFLALIQYLAQIIPLSEIRPRLKILVKIIDMALTEKIKELSNFHRQVAVGFIRGDFKKNSAWCKWKTEVLCSLDHDKTVYDFLDIPFDESRQAELLELMEKTATGKPGTPWWRKIVEKVFERDSAIT